MDRAAAVLTVDLAALVDNWQALSRRVAPACCAAVVKADAYGLGATAVVRALLHAGCREFFVALVDEGIGLREALGAAWHADARLHVLHGPLPGAEQDCLANGLVPVLNSLDQVARWQALARREGRTLPAALQVDTGMARLGLAPDALAQLASSDQGLSGIAMTLVMSHLVSAEDPQDPVSRRQLELFRPWRERFPAALGCLANSSGIFLGPEFHFDLVRPGAALYGVAPVAGEPNPMRPVVSLQARLIDEVQDVHALAQEAGTNAYEILTGLGARYRRQYRGDVAL
jgi:alanine racemase